MVSNPDLLPKMADAREPTDNEQANASAKLLAMISISSKKLEFHEPTALIAYWGCQLGLPSDMAQNHFAVAIE